MSNSLLHPPPPADAGGRPPDGPRPPRERRNPGRGGVAALLVAAAVLGGGSSAGVLVATGAVGGDDATTSATVEPQTSPTSDTSSDSSGGGLDANALYASTAAGVVDITVEGTTSDSPFAPPQESESTATGTGFVIDDEGHILTAAHVVDGASSITVTFQDGTTRSAKLLGQDDATDVAVLSVDPSGLTLHPLTLGDSGSLEVGDEVAAIGDPFGYERSLSTGIVSGLDRTIAAPNGFTVTHAIQTDAALNPGNSGGPVLNAAGEVIGIADQIATNGSSESSTGVGFAVPIDLVKSEIDQLIAGEPVSHAYLGVSTATATDATTAGALVADVAAGGPAAEVGLRAGDIVTAMDSTAVHDGNDLVAAIAAHDPGDKVTLTVRRDDGTEKLSVTLAAQPDSAGT